MHRIFCFKVAIVASGCLACACVHIGRCARLTEAVLPQSSGSDDTPTTPVRCAGGYVLWAGSAGNAADWQLPARFLVLGITLCSPNYFHAFVPSLDHVSEL